MPQKVAYGAGAFVNLFTGSITVQMFNPVFNMTLGISPVVLGGVLMFFRLWDAITDVVMGNISDNARTPWGRRRPFIVVGAILAGIILPLFWNYHSSWSQKGIITYIVLMGMLLYTAVTVWGMPYFSLGLEMTPDYNERTRISAIRTLFAQIAGLIGGWLMALASLKIFANPITGEPDLANGMRHLSWGLGLLVILFGVLPGIFVKERYYAKEAQKQARIGFVSSLKKTLTCKPFMLIMPVYLLVVMGSSMVGALGLYLNIYYVCEGNMKLGGIIAGLQSTVMLVTSILTIPFWAWVSEKIGKRTTLACTIILGFVTNTLMYQCLRPGYPYLQLIPVIFLSASGAALWMLIPSMQADIADYDELENGERREGSFSSVSSWFFKLAITLTAGVSGVILARTGFNVVEYGTSQPPEVLRRMLNLYVFLPMVFWVVALLVLSRYPLSSSRMGEIRKELEERRGII